MPSRKPAPAPTTPTKPRRLRAVKAPAAPRKPEIDPHDAAIQAAIAKMTDDQLQCRDLHHQYKPFHAALVPQDNVYVRKLKCANCGTIRVQTLSLSGYILGSSYEYSEGYLIKGLGRLESDDRAAIRLHSMFNTMPSAAQARQA